MKKIVKVLMLLILSVSLVSMFAACELEEIEGKSAYEIAVDNGYGGTVEEWLAGLVPEAVNIIWHSGRGVPSPSLGANHDIYLDNLNLLVYQKVDGVWVEIKAIGEQIHERVFTGVLDHGRYQYKDVEVTLTIDAETGIVNLHNLDKLNEFIPSANETAQITGVRDGNSTYDGIITNQWIDFDFLGETFDVRYDSQTDTIYINLNQFGHFYQHWTFVKCDDTVGLGGKYELIIVEVVVSENSFILHDYLDFFEFGQGSTIACTLNGINLLSEDTNYVISLFEMKADYAIHCTIGGGGFVVGYNAPKATIVAELDFVGRAGEYVELALAE